MSQELLARAAKIKELNTIKATVPGSGFRAHDLVAFHGEDNVRFVGDDAKKVLDNLKEFVGRISGQDEPPGTHRKLIKIVPKLAITNAPDGTPQLILKLTEWNSFLEGIYAQDLGLTGASLIHDGTTP